jgi:DNA repair exonuclease SbcCD ATPase subunit
LAFEGQELRKKLKQLSVKLYQVEAERCAEQVEFQKQAEEIKKVQRKTPDHYAMNTEFMVELAQLKDIKDNEIKLLKEECRVLKDENFQKDFQAKALTQMLSELEQTKQVELTALRREFEQEVSSIMKKRENVADDQRTAFLRRAMLAEAELEKLKDQRQKTGGCIEFNCDEPSIHHQDLQAICNQRENIILELQEENKELHYDLQEISTSCSQAQLEVSRLIHELSATQASLQTVTEERDVCNQTLDTLVSLKASIEECVKRVQTENSDLRNTLSELTSRIE